MVEKEAINMTGQELDLKALVSAVSLKHSADVILYAGPTYVPADAEFIAHCTTKKKHPNVLLMLTTYGGDPNVAYRIARCLHRKYAGGRFILHVDTDCESAGTLLAVGADEIVMSDHAQLGPIDVQLRKPDELIETLSGLTPTQALDTLKRHTRDYFRFYFIDLKLGASLTTQSSMEAATKLVTGLFQPVFAQLDPIRLGEIDRDMKVASEYGIRLSAGRNNLKDKALAKLLGAYPSHGFVIDREEAATIFQRVREPSAEETALAEALRDECRQHLEEPTPTIRFLGDELVGVEGEQDDAARESDAGRAGPATSGGPAAGTAIEGQPTPDQPAITQLPTARTA